jgi:aromatic ring-opening dioxygenase catalytic subunit (LigB family)
MSHAPGITAFPDAPPVLQRERFFAAVEEARAALEKARPDVLIMIAPDHFTNFFVDNMPPFCIGLNDRYTGPVEDWLRIEKRVIPGAREVAQDILSTGFESGIELAFSETLRLEHGTMVPLSLLTPRMDVPVVWIMMNCQVPPLASLGRCDELGRMIRSVVDRRPERFAILGTGGLSHAPGAPEMGYIDEAFDREFLGFLEKGDLDAVLSLPAKRIDNAGFGAWEIRPWVVAQGAVPERRGRTLVYEPMKEWDTGCAVTLFQ